jgi:hypothetical protein
MWKQVANKEATRADAGGASGHGKFTGAQRVELIGDLSRRGKPSREPDTRHERDGTEWAGNGTNGEQHEQSRD